MKEFDFVEFRNNIQKDFLEANGVIVDIEEYEWDLFHNGSISDVAEEGKRFNENRLAEILEVVKLKIEFAHEYLGLIKLTEKLTEDLKKYDRNYGELQFEEVYEVFFSPVKYILTKHLNVLTSHVKIETESEYEYTNSMMLLEQMLRGTAKMLFDRKIEPTNEAQVRNEVYKNLIHVFPDTVREIPISKVSGTYKPDIGVKRLKSAIEYKFVDSAHEAKIAIGGIFEDIMGYSGSADWTMFYAVIYMTDNYMTQDQVEAEFKLSNVPHHWKPIVVFGKGSREAKNKKDS